MKQAIIVIGNPINGLEFIGPFESTVEAVNYANDDGNIDDHEWWVVQLETPEELK
jgi:hypothetical protein